MDLSKLLTGERKVKTKFELKLYNTCKRKPMLFKSDDGGAIERFFNMNTKRNK